MIRFVFRAAAAAAVAMSLLVAAPAASKPAPKKESAKKVDKKADKKKADKATSKKADKETDKKASKPERASRERKADKKADKKQDKKAAAKPEVASSQKRSKSGDRDDRETAGRPAGDERPAAPKPSGRVEPSVVAYANSMTDSDVEEEEEPAGPRAVNRLVSTIPPARVVEIQTALQKAGVYSGAANGVWDQATYDAMSAFQRRNNFGATGMPTAEALKALGVRKNSGIGIQSPSTVLERTALDGAGRQPEPASPTTSGPQRQ